MPFRRADSLGPKEPRIRLGSDPPREWALMKGPCVRVRYKKPQDEGTACFFSCAVEPAAVECIRRREAWRDAAMRSFAKLLWTPATFSALGFLHWFDMRRAPNDSERGTKFYCLHLRCKPDGSWEMVGMGVLVPRVYGCTFPVDDLETPSVATC